MKNLFLLICVYLLLGGLFMSCNTSSDNFETEEGIAIRKKVDQSIISLDHNISKFEEVLRIDHSRLAEGVGVYTPPSIVTVFSNPKVNSKLLKINQLIGVDLPYKVLCYSEPDLTTASVAYTSAEFIIKRHQVSPDDLVEFSNDISSVIKSFPERAISPVDLSFLDKRYGLIVEKSKFDFNTTLKNLKKGITSQGDTEIFGEIDFQNEAISVGVDIASTTLILFGAPKPGGKAMNETPKIGLDAFCQKLLVFEKDNEVYIAYNDIADFSELYYQNSTIPQRVVNFRLRRVYQKAISE